MVVHLREQQVFAKEQMFERPSLIIDYEAGSGKTYIASAFCSEIKKKVLYASRASLLRQTYNQFRDYDPSLKMQIIKSEKDVEASKDCDVVFVSYNALMKYCNIFNRHRRDILIVDECHNLFGVFYSGCRVEKLIMRSSFFDRKYLMSGTFSDGKSEKYYGSLRFLGEDSKYFGMYHDFEIQYLIKDPK